MHVTKYETSCEQRSTLRVLQFSTYCLAIPRAEVCRHESPEIGFPFYPRTLYVTILSDTRFNEDFIDNICLRPLHPVQGSPETNFLTGRMLRRYIRRSSARHAITPKASLSDQATAASCSTGVGVDTLAATSESRERSLLVYAAPSFQAQRFRSLEHLIGPRANAGPRSLPSPCCRFI